MVANKSLLETATTAMNIVSCLPRLVGKFTHLLYAEDTKDVHSILFWQYKHLIVEPELVEQLAMQLGVYPTCIEIHYFAGV